MSEMPKEIWAHYEQYKPQPRTGTYMATPVSSSLAAKYTRSDKDTITLTREELEAMRNSLFKPDHDDFRQGANALIDELLGMIDG